MAFYAGRIIREPAMENPTIVVLTGRNDLDDQLFGTFSRCQDLLRQPPVQAESRAHLRQLLSVAAGGVVFTTIQRFLPEEKGDRHPVLSDRRNIVVIADEAHRSQYDFIDGFARHMRDALPNASFIGFMGPPRTGRPEHEEPGCRAPPQTPRGRDQGGPPEERGAGALVRRAIGAGRPAPEPGGGGGAGHRGADRAGEGNARRTFFFPTLQLDSA